MRYPYPTLHEIQVQAQAKREMRRWDHAKLLDVVKHRHTISQWIVDLAGAELHSREGSHRA